MDGIEMIAAERERQASEEGWTAEHDDEHTVGELAMAAATYAYPLAGMPAGGGGTIYTGRGAMWPWDRRELKLTPGNRLRELTKAGALIAAEIDRLLREETKR